ncbi:MAG: hypothetical protein IPP19_16435 [Verrucomicrobia bacterium]|nr:hypothetical protein [Verrucomicrobiota bacterium]
MAESGARAAADGGPFQVVTGCAQAGSPAESDVRAVGGDDSEIFGEQHKAR